MNQGVRVTLLMTAVGIAVIQGAGADTIAAKPANTKDGKPYSAPTDKTVPLRVLWGDLHLHTGNSLDAGLNGTRLMPEDAFRFARGEEVVSTTGVPAKLARPYDFLVVTDHSDYMGLPQVLHDGSPELLADPTGKRWYDGVHAGGEAAMGVFHEFVDSTLANKAAVNLPGLAKSSWEMAVHAAEKYNEPGRFTAIIGFEWSSHPGGDNLHRNVIFRDGAEKALQVLPLTTFESSDPEHLWRYLADYEKKTGGQILAIPHNSDLSGGQMFADKTFGGRAIDKAYAEQRAKWEPVAEVTQNKGDSETLPALSPDDEFANFERWDKANILGNKLDTPEQQPFNYLRPSLARGLKYEAKLGVNPFKYGLVGGSDIHNALSAVAADNFFGTNATSEPSPNRMKTAPHKITADSKFQSTFVESGSSGIAGIWARENTRAGIFDALRRKEVYGSTGTRITVRIFAGWDFHKGDAERSDFAEYGYAHGVPMGGDLSGARKGQVPTIVIQAAKDPDGANLDRVQVIKGWVDAKGETHEKVFDAAWAGDRKPGSDGKLPSVGSTVDVANASYSNSIGAAVLDSTWTDTAFNPAERAFYYVRVIEIPTPRWSTYDAKRFGVELPTSVPASVTQRAYTSPVWYAPSGA